MTRSVLRRPEVASLPPEEQGIVAALEFRIAEDVHELLRTMCHHRLAGPMRCLDCGEALGPMHVCQGHAG